MRFQPPSWLNWYKKPEYRDIKEYATNVSAGRRPVSPDGRNGGIPSRLRLDRILANKTCSPMSLYDFYMYLKHIEYSAENLEFYMWNYGFHSPAPLSLTSCCDPGSSPATVPETDDNDSEATQETLAQHLPTHLHHRPLHLQIRPAPPSLPPERTPPPPPTTTGPPNPNHRLINPTPTTNPPLTDLTTITTLFLHPNAPKELNIPPHLRNQTLAALSTATTSGRPPSPDTLRPVAEHCYTLLRNCSHRNFVRLGVGNGTFETVCVATVLGWANLLAGIRVPEEAPEGGCSGRLWGRA
ncbi:hypothetical protein CHGG_10138 [Chaetomium globosum CBS 148.51]|uniref:RGS domain-containing protein n=1 Tax=Chaetomium globosum (strain ATCC 6205 / CBS 148.51 / DSM 1962 / NBRC 6347 / NRRL 1970) TaxID=306901 RepID=Q2GPG6_CHAGB|nr:uncharacterized protein CHGG_10138 [Chaetomium globosum CBS 148.51]EAQ83734.1 hypothetical protein CHGG_10138 [Chaetomium globosum CBS 148.51]